jgi:hypothetical protein
MKSRIWSLACALALAMGAGNAAAIDPPADVRITNVAYAGSACPPGTASVTLAPEATSFTLVLDNSLARIGPEVPLPESWKTCRVSLTVAAPAGFTYAVASADYRGSAALAAGSRALQRATYAFEGDPAQVSTTREFRGPFAASWHVHDATDAAALVWAPCGAERALEIDAQVRLATESADPTSTSSISMEMAGGGTAQTFHLSWRRCS